jgi:hypothetical protein
MLVFPRRFRLILVILACSLISLFAHEAAFAVAESQTNCLQQLTCDLEVCSANHAADSNRCASDYKECCRQSPEDCRIRSGNKPRVPIFGFSCLDRKESCLASANNTLQTCTDSAAEEFLHCSAMSPAS